jgi:hypothetical protein
MNRLRLTEDERSRILNLHGSKLITEQSNPKVSEIQTYLLGTKKYDLGRTGPNKDGVDGVWGKRTRDAVKAEFGVEIDNTGNVLKSDPAGTQQAPAGTQQDPAGTQQDPAGTQQTPAGTQQTPAETQQDPAGTQQAPAGTQQPAGDVGGNITSYG